MNTITIAIDARDSDPGESPLAGLLEARDQYTVTNLFAAVLTADNIDSYIVDSDDVFEVYSKDFELGIRHRREGGDATKFPIRLAVVPGDWRETPAHRQSVFLASVKIAVTLSRRFGVSVEIEFVPAWV